MLRDMNERDLPEYKEHDRFLRRFHHVFVLIKFIIYTQIAVGINPK